LQKTEHTTGSVAAPVPAATEAGARPAASAKPPRITTRADGQIMRGLTMLLFALTAAGALAVWRRRIKRLMTTRTR
jgi:Ca-activated chloride channel family protein